MASDYDIDWLKDQVQQLQSKLNKAETDIADIQNSLLTVGYPEGFPVIGQTRSAALASTLTAKDISAAKWVARATTTISSLLIPIYNIATASKKIKVAVYSDNNDAPNLLLGYSRDYDLPSGTIDREIIYRLNTPISVVQGTHYWLCYKSSSNINSYDSDNSPRGTYGRYKTTTNYEDPFPNPFGSSTGNWVNKAIIGLH